MNLWMPPDNEEQREFWERTAAGCCGPACCAVLLKTNVQYVVKNWPDYKGYGPLKEVRSFLTRNGFLVQPERGRKARKLTAQTWVRICRIQWIGKEGGRFHGYKSFMVAARNTHYIVVQGNRFFCNSAGWQELSELPRYLKNGYITTILNVWRYE